MADTKISALADGTPPQNGDQFPVARGAGNVKLLWSAIVSALSALFDPAGAAASEVAVHEAASDPHPGYAPELNPAFTGYLDVAAIAVPAAPASGARIFVQDIANRMMPKFMGPPGMGVHVQPAIFNNRVVMFLPTTGAGGTGPALGLAWTSNGTVTHPTPATTAPAISNQQKRTRYANVVTTTNQQLGPRFNSVSENMFWRGNAAGLGGFFFYTRFIVELWAASTCRIFAGLVSGASSSVVISDTVVNNTCGLWHDTTDPNSGANSFNFVTRDTTTTTKQSIALSNAIAAGNSYEFYMFCAPNGSTIYWRLVDIVNNVVYTGNTGTTLPAATAFMQPQVQMSNGTANITATTVAIGVAAIYVESDR